MKEFFKNLGRYKVSSTLNILGLGIAFAAVYIILVQVNFDLTYNRCFKDAERVYRLDLTSSVLGSQGKWLAHISHNIGRPLGEDNDNIESYGHLYALVTWEDKWYIPCEDREDEDVTIKISAGSEFLPKTIGFELIAGSCDELPPESVLISESLARKHGLKVGDVVKKENTLFTIKGIYRDFPENCILSGSEMFVMLPDEGDSLEYIYFFKLIGEGQEEAFLLNAAKKLKNFMPAFLGETWEEPAADDKEGWLNAVNQVLRIVPLYDSYFTGDLDGIKLPTANPITTYTLLSIAVLILVIAFINFVNFFMAMVPRRIRRVNTEKVFGCPTWRLRRGFIGEAMGLVAIALLLAAYIVFMIASELNGLISTSVAIHDNPKIVLIVVAVALMLAVVSSIYPAYYITSVPPAFALKGSFGNTAAGRRLRYVLLTVQFVISISLITCSIFIRMQYSYVRNYDMGFNKEHLLTANIGKAGKAYWDYNLRQQLTSELKSNPMIVDVTFARSSFMDELRQTLNLHGMDGREMSVQAYQVAHNFMKFMGIEVKEGRSHRVEDEQQSEAQFIFNETARTEYGIKLNEKFNYYWGGNAIGFCDDFKFRSIQLETLPFAFSVKKHEGYLSQLYVRTTPNADGDAVKAHIYNCIKKMDDSVLPEDIIVEFFDEELGRQYEKERELNRLITIFALISICIALMGVFGLVFFETQYRRREIALRRVHGAQISEILRMFVMQYARMVLVAFLFAVPVSYLIMSRWLEGYAYHIPLYWWVFALALIIVLAVTSAIVLARSWKAARENPVNALYKE